MTRDGVEFDERTGMEVAIVGMACRFPGAESVSEFWANLRGGVDSFHRVTAADLEAEGLPPSLLASPGYVPVARPVADFDRFDAGFFGVGAREAEIMDPQHRIFLECSWEALEDAGYDPARIRGSVGVYAGSRMNAYLLNVISQAGLAEQVGELSIQLANDKDYLASRVSYKLDLGGPSVTVQSACSTALVAVHMGCQALVAGECDMTLAGGVALRYPTLGYAFRDGGVQSPDGRVRAFDAAARGTMFGSGMGVVVLKRLDDALTDGDTIHAVVRGSAVSNDGSDRVGFAAPGVDGQVRVVRAALLAADVDPETVTFVEAHGTGTPMGDPIEVEALSRVFRESTQKRGYCALGSAKTNIGHAGAAAGIAGLIKAALALEHREIPPTLHFETPNRQIDFAASPFFVNTEGLPWEANGRPRRAGVSSFGMGGTNAHVVLEEAPPQEPGGPSRPRQLLVLSARTPAALDAAAERLAGHLESGAGGDLADAAFTLRVGRRAFPHRRAVVCADAQEAVAALRGEAPDRRASGSAADEPAVAFLFSGQGAQYPGMGRGLYDSEAVFREAIDRSAEILRPHLDTAGEPDLLELLYPAGGAGDEAAERLARTSCAQPALFAVEYAIARLWHSWGVRPRAMIGHSIGEYVAACLAGVFTLEDALALVAARGRLMQGLPAGSMLAVPLAEEEVEALLGPQLALAAVNAPGRCVVSGPAEAVEALRETLAGRDVPCRPLHTSHAFHSPMMEPILAPFAELLSGLRLQAPEVPFVSNVTGSWITAAEATDPGYWARHLRQPVRFAAGLATLLEAAPETALVEVGPGNTLTTLAARHPARRAGAPAASSLPHPKQNGDDLGHILHALGGLWCRGVAVDWDGFHRGERRRRVPLPTYPFERQRYWLEMGDGVGMARPLARRADPGDWYYLPCWKPSGAPRPAAEGDEAGAPWLVFDDPESEEVRALAAAVVARLAADGRRAISVARGPGYRRAGDDRYEVGASRADYEALLRDLAERDAAPARVVHLWGVGYRAGDDPAAEDALERGFWSLLHLGQALGKGLGGASPRVAVATAGMQRVAGEEAPAAALAGLLGACRVIPQEHAAIRCASVDLAAGELQARPEELAEALVAELDAGLPDGVVAYRSGARWLRDFTSAHLPAARQDRSRLREGGVYLVTGGLGGFGLTFAEHLARHHRARLVLVGRSPLPPRAEWDGWLAERGPDDRTSRRLLALRELEAAGAEVVVEAADVADAEAMAGVVERARERFGRLDGVIHAAGVPGGGIVQLKTREAAAAVLAPKVQGTLALERALERAGVEPDFVLLCSSTLGVLGSFGQVDYAAANAFLDAHAHARAGAGGRHTVSINWCAWGEVGMAVETKLPPGLAAPRAAGRAGAPPPSPLHPLLDRLVEEADGRRTYATAFSPERHWVLSDHRILDAPTIPGTTWIEMARAGFEALAGPGPVEVRDLLFFTPVIVHDGESLEVRLVLEGDAAGAEFRIETDAAAAAGGPPRLHAQGRVLRSEAGAGRTDVEALLSRFERVEAGIPGGGAETGARLVHWGPRWQSLREVWAGEDEGVAVLELPAEFTGDVDTLGVHPTLLDIGTAMGAVALERETYLPLSYKRVRVSAPLPARVFSHLRRVGGGSGAETTRFDVTFLDVQGRELVAIEGFTLKRAGEAGRRLAERKRAAGGASAGGPEAGERPAAGDAADPAAAPGRDTMFGADGISRVEGVEILERVLSWGCQPQIVVNPRDFLELIARARAVDLAAVGERAGDAGVGARNERPELETDFVEPRSEVETRLAAIWRRTLNLERIGVHDNFFDLGGDSIVAINLVASMAKEGFELSPDQLFERQTIAELAQVLGEGGEARDPAEVWQAWLEEQAAGPWAESASYWLAEERFGAAPVAGAGGAGDGAGERDRLAVRLDAEAAGTLVDEVLPDLRATLEEAALSALASALCRRAGTDRLVVRLVGDGRSAAPAELGLAGGDRPLLYSFPALFDLSGLAAAEPVEVVRAVKEQRRAVPGAGAAFAALRRQQADPSVHRRLEAMPLPSVGLSMAGFEPPPGDGLGEPALELRIGRDADGLELAWSFDPGVLGRDAVSAVADEVAALLASLGRGAAGRDADVLSPTDFPDADLSREDLDKVLTQLKGRA